MNCILFLVYYKWTTLYTIPPIIVNRFRISTIPFLVETHPVDNKIFNLKRWQIKVWLGTAYWILPTFR